MGRATIKDIARHLKINPSTVSRALRDHPDVSKKKKEEIKELAEKLGYKPNQNAINLRRGKSGIIGLIIPEITHYFFPGLIKAIEQTVHDKGFQLLILQSNENVEREIQNAEICEQLGVDGILVSLTQHSSDCSHFQRIEESGIPVIYFDRISGNPGSYKVSMDGEQAAFEAMNYLLTKHPSFNKVAGMFGDQRYSITNERISGFRRALFEHGIKPVPTMFHFAHNAKEAELIFETFWKSKKHPELLFMMTDEIFEGVLKASHRLKLNLPREMKMVLMSDGMLPELCEFKIPFVKTSGFRLGQEACSLLFRLMDKEQPSPKPGTFFIETPFVNPD